MTEALSNQNLVQAAYAIAAKAHIDQPYNFQNYITHPQEVAELAHKYGYPSEVVAGCFLHDTIEDTHVTAESLLSDGMPLVVVEGVIAVTYTDEDITLGVDKMEKARSHPLGHVIKFCDSSQNFATSVSHPAILDMEEPGKAIRFAKKYADFVFRLSPGLPTPEEIKAYLETRAT